MKLFFFIFFLSSSAWAISVGEMTYFMGSDQDYLSKAVVNDSAKTRYYQLSVEETSPPYEGAVRKKAENGTLLFGPKQLLLRPNETKYIKLYYQGPSDDQARYYRITFIERPGFLKQDVGKSRFDSIASLGTILVVQPRQAKQSHKTENGILFNTGNTVYLAMAEAPCLYKAELCEKEKYLIPGGQLSLDNLTPDLGSVFLVNEKTQKHAIGPLVK